MQSAMIQMVRSEVEVQLGKYYQNIMEEVDLLESGQKSSRSKGQRFSRKYLSVHVPCVLMCVAQPRAYSHVSVYEINLPSDWFETYTLERAVTIGINTNTLFKVLHTREKTHDLRLKLEDISDDKLEIALHSESKDVIDLNYLRKLICVILNSYMVGCGPCRLARDLNFQKNDPQTLKNDVSP